VTRSNVQVSLADVQYKCFGKLTFDAGGGELCSTDPDASGIVKKETAACMGCSCPVGAPAAAVLKSEAGRSDP
jgi:hypothetical protein